jgi:hypothetical protein
MGGEEPVGKRIGRFLGLMGVVGVVSAGVVISQRLSDDTLALLVGLTCGVLAMAPTLGIGVWLWRREEQQRREAVSQSRMGQPPVIVVTPQMLPGYGPQQPALSDSRSAPWPWTPSPQQRTFTIVGGEE